jgi:hypothetical protein
MSGATATLAAGWLDLGSLEGPDNKFYRPEINAETGEPEEITSIHSKTISPITQFSRLPVPLTKQGQSNSALYPFAKTADFAGNVHMRFKTPLITVNNANVDLYRIAYTPNMAHWALRQVTLFANEIPLVKFGPVAMDQLSEINLGAGQYEGYMKGIGNTPAALTFNSYLPPLKIKKNFHELFFCQKNRPSPQDNFPLTACKNNTIALQLDFVETLESLIRIQRNTAAAGQPKVWVDEDPRNVNLSTIVTVTGSSGLAMPVPDVWCEYACVRPEERAAFQAGQIDLAYKVIHSFTGQRQSAGTYRQPFNFSGPVRYLAFAWRNQTAQDHRNFGNYSTVATDDALGRDPVGAVTLWYDNNPRIQNMDGDHFSETETLYHAARVPMKPGVAHLLPYCEDTTSSELDGTSNYSRLSTDLELSLVEASTDPNVAATPACQYSMEIVAEGLSIMRFENKSISFPNF